MNKPRFLDDQAYKCLRAGEFDSFRQIVERSKTVDFSGADLRSVDFRPVDMSKIVLRNAYLRDADLRGVDLRQVDLEGASIHNTRVAGAYFPDNLTPAEIQLSLQHGTRLRTTKK